MWLFIENNKKIDAQNSLHEFCVLLVCLGQRPAKKRLLGRKNGGRQAASTITIYLAAYSFARRYYFPGTF